MSTYNNFEFLLFAASEEYCQDQAKEFLLADDEGFEITARHRKLLKQIERENTKKLRKRSTVLKWKWIAAACLLSLSVVLTACVSIPEIREAIKDFFLEWYDDFVSIGFGNEKTDSYDYENIEDGERQDDEPDPSTPNSDDVADQESPAPPTEILRKAYATYLPGDYTEVVDLESSFYYSVSYYDDSNFVFFLTQNVITQDLHWTNSDSQKISYSTVNGFNAIIVENVITPNQYMILWQDNEYEYNIEGNFYNVSEIIEVAKGIKLK